MDRDTRLDIQTIHHFNIMEQIQIHIFKIIQFHFIKIECTIRQLF